MIDGLAVRPAHVNGPLGRKACRGEGFGGGVGEDRAQLIVERTEFLRRGLPFGGDAFERVPYRVWVRPMQGDEDFEREPGQFAVEADENRVNAVS